MDELNEFLSFTTAVEKGFSSEGLVRQKYDEANAYLKQRVSDIVSELKGELKTFTTQTDQVMEESRDFDTKFATVYSAQLQVAVDELSVGIKNLDMQSVKAVRDINEQNRQNRMLLNEVRFMNEVLKQPQPRSEYQRQVVAIGNASSKHISQRGATS